MNELMARLRPPSAVRPTRPGRRPSSRSATSRSTSPASGCLAGADVPLTPTEWAFLELLARNLGRLVTREQILREVWGPAYEKESHYLRVYAAQLRASSSDPPTTTCHLCRWLHAGRAGAPRALGFDG